MASRGDYFGLSGHAIDGQFHAIEVAGEGGFSVVYRGMHLTMREPIAIKCLKLQIKSNDPQVIASFTQRFFDESRIMYRLSQGNLNIVRAITTGVTVSPAMGETVPYMVLEWLDGVSMSKHMKDNRAKKLPAPALREVIELFEPAALAIAYAHSQGVVHRDVKPGNLFLQNTRDAPPRMKVLDFGMAKVLSPENMGGLESAETLNNVMVVSPQYVTPEQLDKAHGPIGPWTDVYAFALILVEALTNKRARDAESFADLMIQITKDGNPPTPRARGAIVTDAVDAVFKRAFAREPSKRQPDLGTFWRELKDAASRAPASGRTSVDAPILQAPDLSATKMDFTKTMPLERPRGHDERARANEAAIAEAPRPAAGRRAFSGTMPMPSVAEPPRDVPPPISHASAAGLRAALAVVEAARPSTVSALETARPSVAVASSQEPPRSLQHALVIPDKIPRVAEPQREVTARRPRPKPTPSTAEKPRANRVLVAFLFLFVLASLTASAALFAHVFGVRY